MSRKWIAVGVVAGALASSCASWRELPAEDRAVLLRAGIDAVARVAATMESIGVKPGVSPEEVHPATTIPAGLLWPKSNHIDVAPGAAGVPTNFCQLADGSWEDVGFLRKPTPEGYYEICWSRTPTESDPRNGEWVLFDIGRTDHVLTASARNRYVKGFSYGPWHNMHDDSRMYFADVYGRQPAAVEKMDLDHDRGLYNALVKEWNRRFLSSPVTPPPPPVTTPSVPSPPPPACPPPAACPPVRECPRFVIPPEVLETLRAAPESVAVPNGKARAKALAWKAKLEAAKVWAEGVNAVSAVSEPAGGDSCARLCEGE